MSVRPLDPALENALSSIHAAQRSEQMRWTPTSGLLEDAHRT